MVPKVYSEGSNSVLSKSKPIQNPDALLSLVSISHQNAEFSMFKNVLSTKIFRAIFEKTGASGKTESYATVALGSRDRSISVWSTNLKRPFFVINDIFEQSVLDLSWSKDGRVLLAW